jgi:hypothetical protein
VHGGNGALRSVSPISSLKENRDPWLHAVEADVSRDSEILVATSAAQLNSAAHE